MAAPAVSDAHANAVQSAARRMEGKRERRVVLARGTESRNGRAATPGPLKWANFIEILIGVVSTDLNHRGASPHARDLLHWFATPTAADCEIVRMRIWCVNTNENDSHQYY
ncbi:hypothetical protein VSR69_30045 [Paraburkholderia phytofirmans]|jgi:hypothetical protein|uniref:hypothetical protein n=1 Tax=unclassified Paraburkholderia TaxID=2615204 RepID=UPI001FB224F4|nr:hypothetical protein [Paraburkholderia sp. BL9I2N2]